MGSFDRIVSPNLSNTPMTPTGVGGGIPTRWIYSEYGRFLSVYGIRNGVSVTFNLASADDIEVKLKNLYSMRDRGLVDNIDLQELEERLRIMSNINFYGNGSQNQTSAALHEGVVLEGEGKSLSSKYDFAIVTYDKSKMSRKGLKPWSILSLKDDGKRTNDGEPWVKGAFGNEVVKVRSGKDGATGLYLVTKSAASKIEKCKTEDAVLDTIDKLCDKVDVKKVDYDKIFDVKVDEEAQPTTSPAKLAHMRRMQELAHTDEANKKRRKTIAARQESKLLGLNEDASIDEAMKVVNLEVYDTPFGKFRIETQEGKARRRDYTGKTVWKQVKSTIGFFVDYPKAVEFFLERDGDDVYVSSSQGDRSSDWVSSVGANSYDKALHTVDSDVVKCFRDYFKDNSIG